MGRDVRGRFKTEGAYVYLRFIHVYAWQKPTQYCKAILLQLKVNLSIKKHWKKREKNKNRVII